MASARPGAAKAALVEAEDSRTCWLFTGEGLDQMRRQAHERAVLALQALGGGAAGDGAAAPTAPPGGGGREAAGPLSLEDGASLALFYAQKLPELCRLCGASGDVRWTAVVFYRRFYAARSPMEFDPLPIMFACVHLACKVEEEHHITLEKLLSSADFGADRAMMARVTSSELSLLDGLRYQLLVEPKPHGALSMLFEEMRGQPEAGSASLVEAAGGAAVEKAEELLCSLCLRTDAVLLWPASALLAAALLAALGNSADASPSADGAAGLLRSVLEQRLVTEAQRSAARRMVQAVQRELDALASAPPPLDSARLQEVRRSARKCHRAFERWRADATARSDAARKEQKKRSREATPSAAGRNLFEELKRATAEVRAGGLQDAGDMAAEG